MANNPAQSELESAVKVSTEDEGKLREWAKKLDVSTQQVREAVAAVGANAGDVEMHLKGSRASSNAAKEIAAEHLDDGSGQATR